MKIERAVMQSPALVAISQFTTAKGKRKKKNRKHTTED